MIELPIKSALSYRALRAQATKKNMTMTACVSFFTGSAILSELSIAVRHQLKQGAKGVIYACYGVK